MGHNEENKKPLLVVMANFASGESGPAQLSALMTRAKAGRRLNLEQFAEEGSPLARLKVHLALVDDQTLTALDSFVANNPELHALKEANRAMLNEFDLFETLNLYSREEIHSRALAWLLDPRQNHHLGEHFLRNFLTATKLIKAEDIDDHDWLRATVEREWSAVVDDTQGYLDILVVNRRLRILCAIENKVFSEESIGEDGISQLTHYRKALESDFTDFDRYYVFLSPEGRAAHHEEERNFWAPMNYGVIRRLVEQEAADRNTVLPDEIRLFLQQYATTIRRKIVPESNAMQKLARKIYLENREVVDLLKQNEPDWVGDAKQMLKEAVAQQSQWKLDVDAPQFVRFRPVDWDQFHSTQTGTGWSASKSLILFEFRFTESMPWLGLALSSGSDGAVRNRLFEAARQHPGVFRLKERFAKDSWVTLHEEEDYILDESDYSARWDDGSVRAKIMDWVSTFAGDKFLKMNDIIIDCLTEYEQGRSQSRP